MIEVSIYINIYFVSIEYGCIFIVPSTSNFFSDLAILIGGSPNLRWECDPEEERELELLEDVGQGRRGRFQGPVGCDDEGRGQEHGIGRQVFGQGD